MGGHKLYAHAAGLVLDLFIVILPFLLCFYEDDHTSVSAFSVVSCEFRMFSSKLFTPRVVSWVLDVKKIRGGVFLCVFTLECINEMALHPRPH